MSREVSTLLRKRRILSAPCHRRKHILWLHKATGEQRPPSLRPGGRGLMVRDGGDSCCPGEDGGRVDVDTCWIFFFSFLSPPGCYSYLPGATVSLLVRLTPPFFFRRGLVESGLDCSVLFWLCGPFGRLVLHWGGSFMIINIFGCSIRPTFLVMWGLSCLLFIVVLVPVAVLFYYLQQTFILLFTLPYF